MSSKLNCLATINIDWKVFCKSSKSEAPFFVFQEIVPVDIQ